MNYRRPVMKYKCMAPFEAQEKCDHYQRTQESQQRCRFFSIFSGCMKPNDAQN